MTPSRVVHVVSSIHNNGLMMSRCWYVPGDVRNESSASERCILSLEERPLSLVVDTARTAKPSFSTWKC